MPLLRYSPFAKERRDVTTTDLAVLRDTSEGWYVDYKRELPSASAIGKHVSSFANTYGGWLFIGVVSGGPANTAQEFCGIPTCEVPGVMEKISQACAAHVSPDPYFEVTALTGPDPEIGLAADTSILVIEVPSGARSPYVHSSGRIYRRVGEHSDPKPETDRGMLDLLWERSARRGKRLTRRFRRVVQHSEAEGTSTFLYLFVLPDPDGDRLYRSKLRFAEFASILRAAPEERGSPFGVPFDSIYSTANGFTARQTQNNDPELSTLSLCYENDGSFMATVPVQSFDYATTDRLTTAHWLRYRNVNTFRDALARQRFHNPRILDLTALFFVLAGLLSLRRALSAADGLTAPEFFWKVRVDQTWRRVPFLDTAFWSEHVNRFGIPFNASSSISIPHEAAELAVLEPGPFEGVEPKEDWTVDLTNAAMMMIYVANALGVPAPLGNGTEMARFTREMVALHPLFDNSGSDA